MSSLLERWYPVTDDFGLIQAALPLLLSEFENWQRSFGVEYLRTEVFSSLADAFESLLPLPTAKCVDCSLQRGQIGWPAFKHSRFRPIPRNILFGTMRVCCTPEDAGIWEGYAPEVRGGCPPLGYWRAIGALDDAVGGCSKSQMPRGATRSFQP
jgi:hypothetical protein